DKAYPTRNIVPTASPVFAVAKDRTHEIDDKNSRMVVDVRPVNTWVLTDMYPMKTMPEMMGKAADATHITMFDAMAFY
ncbi:uncharacterized protein LY79DRAFT_697500, partial [Colletotrichum navitas]